MTEETNVGQAGAEGTSKPPVSPAPVADADSIVKLVEEVRSIKKEIGGIYSRQDKDRNAFGEFMAEFKKQKGKGLSDDDAETAANSALKEREEREQERQWRQAVSEKLGLAGPKSGDNAQKPVVDIAKVIAELELPADHPEVALLKARQFDNDEKAYAAAAKVLAGMKAKPTPSDADRAATPAPPAQKGGDAQEEYIKAMREAPRGYAGKAAREAAKAKAIKAGVDVYSIDFT